MCVHISAWSPTWKLPIILASPTIRVSCSVVFLLDIVLFIHQYVWSAYCAPHKRVCPVVLQLKMWPGSVLDLRKLSSSQTYFTWGCILNKIPRWFLWTWMCERHCLIPRTAIHLAQLFLGLLLALHIVILSSPGEQVEIEGHCSGGFVLKHTPQKKSLCSSDLESPFSSQRYVLSFVLAQELGSAGAYKVAACLLLKQQEGTPPLTLVGRCRAFSSFREANLAIFAGDQMLLFRRTSYCSVCVPMTASYLL